MDNRTRYRVPEELRETLLDFTIAYLLERPGNLVDFGIQFFQRLKGERESGGGSGGGRNSQGNSTLNGRNEDDVEGSSSNRNKRPSQKQPSAPSLVGNLHNPRQSHRHSQNQDHHTSDNFESVTQVAESLVEQSVNEAGAIVEGRRRRQSDNN